MLVLLACATGSSDATVSVPLMRTIHHCSWQVTWAEAPTCCQVKSTVHDVLQHVALMWGFTFVELQTLQVQASNLMSRQPDCSWTCSLSCQRKLRPQHSPFPPPLSDPSSARLL